MYKAILASLIIVAGIVVLFKALMKDFSSFWNFDRTVGFVSAVSSVLFGIIAIILTYKYGESREQIDEISKIVKGQDTLIKNQDKELNTLSGILTGQDSQINKLTGISERLEKANELNQKQFVLNQAAHINSLRSLHSHLEQLFRATQDANDITLDQVRIFFSRLAIILDEGASSNPILSADANLQPKWRILDRRLGLDIYRINTDDGPVYNELFRQFLDEAFQPFYRSLSEFLKTH